MGGKWKESKKWFSNEFYSTLFNSEYTGIAGKIFFSFFYSFILISAWNISKDSTISLPINISIYKDGLSIKHIMKYGSYLIFYIGLKIVNDREILNTKLFGVGSKNKSSLSEILPIKKKDYVTGRFILMIIINMPLIITFIAIYLSDINPLILGVRGQCTIIILLFLLSSTIANTTHFIKNRKIVLISKIINALFSIAWIIGILSFNESIGNYINEIFRYTGMSSVTKFIGEFYIGISICIASLVAFYYFNYKYILNGIQEKRWGM